MIEKFCSRLPKDLSNQMYNEYYNRLREINYILASLSSFINSDDYTVHEYENTYPYHITESSKYIK